MKRFLILILVMGLASSAAKVCADEIPLAEEKSKPTGAISLSRWSVDERLAYIEDSLNEEARRDKIWLWGWGAGLGTATVAQLAILPFVSAKGDRVDLIIGAATAGFGLATYWIPQSYTLRDARRLRELRANQGSDKDAEALLATAEEMLRHNAQIEKSSRGIWAHSINVGFNLAAGAIQGFGYDRWTSAAITVGAGIAVGEILILTQPKHLIAEEEYYREREKELSLIKSWGLSPWVGKSTYGLSLSVIF